MSQPKDFYRTYIADNNWSQLSTMLINKIASENPIHALEFGCGTGKHLLELNNIGIEAIGIDISMPNILTSYYKNNNQLLIAADEKILRYLCNFDVVFTCSVLDHIENVKEIIEEFKRIVNKAIYLAEAERCDPTNFYWNHNYEFLGFEKLDFHWRSPDDEAKYNIWRWTKQ